MHDLIRWADDLRHYLASCLNASAVGGNTGAAVYWSLFAGIVSYALWPKLRRRVDAWVKGHLHAHHEALKATLDEHHDRILASVREHLSIKEHARDETEGEADDGGTEGGDGAAEQLQGQGVPRHVASG